MIPEIEDARKRGIFAFVNIRGVIIYNKGEVNTIRHTGGFSSRACKRTEAQSIMGKYLKYAPCRNWFRENFIITYDEFDHGMNKSGYYFEWEQNVINNILTKDKQAKGK